MTIIRTDSMLYWTGSEWSPDQNGAKIYPDHASAAAEIMALPKPPTGELVHIIAVTSAN